MNRSTEPLDLACYPYSECDVFKAKRCSFVVGSTPPCASCCFAETQENVNETPNLEYEMTRFHMAAKQHIRDDTNASKSVFEAAVKYAGELVGNFSNQGDE